MRQFLFRALLVATFVTCVFEAIAESVTVNLTREGTLAEKVLEQASSLATVTELTVTGTINADDWNCITVQMTGLSALDLSQAAASFEAITTFNGNIKTFSFPKGIKQVGGNGNDIFRSLTSCTFNDELEIIKRNAFANSNITSIVLPKSLKEIQNRAFYDSSISVADLSNIDAENCTFGNDLFYYCQSLSSVTLPGNMRDIPASFFSNCRVLKNIEIPSTVKSIGRYAFNGCRGLEDIALPENIRYIEDYTFSGCTSLKQIVLPTSLTSIGSSAFSGCTALTEVAFPESVTFIGANAFSNCSGLTKVTSLIPFPISASSGIFTGIDQENCTLVVPEWSALLYKMAIGWSEFAKIETVATGDLALLTVNDTRYLPESVRPNGTPDVFISDNGSLTVRGEKKFDMNELTMNMNIGIGQWKWGYDENGNYREYYSPALCGSSLFNDESNLTAKNAKLGLRSKGATWGFITLPFDAELSEIAPMADGDTINYIWKTYDGERRALLGSGGNWKEATGTLKAGVGYIYQSQNDDSIFVKAVASSLTNMLSSGDITLPLTTYTASDTEDESWNFIGNPYPTYFNTRYIDFTAPITVWNGYGYDAISLTDDDYTLAPCQAFFVQKQADTESIKFFAEGRAAEPLSSGNQYYAKSRIKAETSREIINVYLEGTDYKDKCRVVFNEAASMDYELNCDATKFMSEDGTIPQLYSSDNMGRQYAINERPKGNGCVNLGVVMPKAGQYTISTDKNNQGQALYLYDTKENVLAELGTADYTFHSDATVSNGRFVLTRDKNATGIKADMGSSLQIEVANGDIVVSGASGQTIEVYTLDGKCVCDIEVARQQEIVAVGQGAYIVKVGEKSFKTIIK